jgi:Chitobiase/beta-hexosaminidase C-terminal domain
MKKLWLLALLLSLPAMGQVFNCSTFTTTNTSCGVGGLISGSGSAFKVLGTQSGVTPTLTGGNVVIAPSGGDHFALSMMYQTAVNVQAFTTAFTFVPNNQNIAFTFNNCANNGSSGYGTCGGFALASFSSGASCEGGFSQAFSGNPFPYNVFAFMIDTNGRLQPSDSGYTYSSEQIYQQNQSPCNPGSGGAYTPYTDKFSTSPVPLNSPSNSNAAPTGDTYSITMSYDGSNLNTCLYDVTAANGSCSSSTSGTGTYVLKSWANVSIPSQVDGTTAYIGIVGSSGEASNGNLQVNSWTYTVNTATASPGSTVTAAGAPTATNPSFSPAAGSYSGTQNVTISSSGSSNICYTLGAAGLTLTPIANQNGGCGVGTLYSGAVSVSSSQTLYATAGLNNTGLSSGVVQGVYTIGGGGGAASQPTFSPAAGTYTGAQSVTLSTSSSGAIICYTTNGSTPATNGSTGCATGSLYSSAIGVAVSETVKAIAGGTGYTDSSVGSAAYTIKANTPTFSPVAGTYVGSQSVTISSTSGSVICYNTTGSPATNGSSGCTTGTLYSSPVAVSSSQTLYAVAGGTGYSDSSVGSASYVVSSPVPAVIGGKIVITGKTVLQ